MPYPYAHALRVRKPRTLKHIRSHKHAHIRTLMHDIHRRHTPHPTPHTYTQTTDANTHAPHAYDRQQTYTDSAHIRTQTYTLAVGAHTYADSALSTNDRQQTAHTYIYI